MPAPLPPHARLRFDVIDRLLAGFEGAETFVEVGCGEGALATTLADRFVYEGYEPDQTAYAVAHDRLAGHPTARLVNAALPDNPSRSFDVLGAFEVLEHLADDSGALDAWVRWVRPGGHVIVSVPAHQHRFGPWDEAVGHFRRYSRRGLHDLMAGAGLVDVDVVAYGFPLGYALEWGRNRIATRRMAATGSMEARTAASGRVLQPGQRLAWPIRAATAPFAYLQRPFAASDRGTGWVAAAHRPW